MELDPIKLLCSGNPLDALIALLKKQLKDAIASSKGVINEAITAIKNKLKAAMDALIPELPEKPAFLVELMALKDKITGSITEFNKAAVALIEKWGKAVANILDIINQLANLSICDLLTLNFKMNPDGTIELEGPPAKTPTAGPEKSVPAESTVTNNLPTNFSTKTSAATNSGNSITKTIEDGELFQLKLSADSNLESLTQQPSYSSFESKCKSQGVELSNTNVQNLTAGEKTIQEAYITFYKDIEEIKAAINACKLSCTAVNNQLLQRIREKNQGKISSEEVASILDSMPGLIIESTSHTVKTPAIVSARDSTAESLKSTMTAEWKSIADRAAMQIGIDAVQVIEGQKFTDWFNSQGFKHVTASQISNLFSNTTRRGVVNGTPPSSLWPNIVPTIRVLDALIDQIGGKITINSAWRSPAYNASIATYTSGVAKNSLHTQFKAIDFTVSGYTPKQIFDQLRQWRSQGRFTGGLGSYGTFTHVDTGDRRSTWFG